MLSAGAGRAQLSAAADLRPLAGSAGMRIRACGPGGAGAFPARLPDRSIATIYKPPGSGVRGSRALDIASLRRRHRRRERSVAWMLAVLLAQGLLLACGSARAAQGTAPVEPIRFGILPIGSAAESLEQWRPLLDDLRKTFGPHAELCVSSSSAPNLRKYLRALKVRCRTSLEIGCPCRRLCHCTPAQWPPTTLAGPSAAAGRRRRLAEQPQRYQRCPGGRGPGADA